MPTIEFNTTNEKAFKEFRPVVAKHIHPDWWKKMKTKTRGGDNIKMCPSMMDVLGTGYYIICVEDIKIEYPKDDLDGSPKYELGQFAKCPNNPNYETSGHPREQFPDFEYAKADVEENLENNNAVKIRVPWSITTPLGYSSLYLDPFLFQNRFFQTWQGIMDTDRYTGGDLNGLVILYPKTREEFVIPAGTPIAQIVPYRREDWKASIDLIKTEQYQKEHNPFLYHKYREEDNKLFKKGDDDYDKPWSPKAPLFDKEISDPFNVLPLTKEEELLEKEMHDKALSLKPLRETIKD